MMLNPELNRRELLARLGTGLPMAGLAALMADAGMLASPAEAGVKPPAASRDARSADPLAPRPSHFPGKAKHIIHIYLNGGPSQVDTFDPKPVLQKYNGQQLPTGHLTTERKTGY